MPSLFPVWRMASMEAVEDHPCCTGAAKARDLVMAHGHNATACQILNPGIGYWFSARLDAVVGLCASRLLAARSRRAGLSCPSGALSGRHRRIRSLHAKPGTPGLLCLRGGFPAGFVDSYRTITHAFQHHHRSPARLEPLALARHRAIAQLTAGATSPLDQQRGKD